MCAVHTCARSSLLTEQAHTCAGHWAGDGPAQASGMTARHTCGWGGWGTQPWTWTRAEHLGGASMTWSWWAGPRGCCWGQVFKGLGPHGMSQAPTATRLGLPGAAAGCRGPLRTFEQEADDVTMVPGVCEGGELSVLEGANRGHERRPQEVVAACSGYRKLGEAHVRVTLVHWPKSEDRGQVCRAAWRSGGLEGSERAWVTVTNGKSLPWDHWDMRPPPQHGWDQERPYGSGVTSRHPFLLLTRFSDVTWTGAWAQLGPEDAWTPVAPTSCAWR